MVPSIDKQSNTTITGIQSTRPTPGDKILTTRAGTSRYGILSKPAEIGGKIIVYPGMSPKGLAGGAEAIIEYFCLLDLSRFLMTYGSVSSLPYLVLLRYNDSGPFNATLSNQYNYGYRGYGSYTRHYFVQINYTNGGIYRGDFYIEYNDPYLNDDFNYCTEIWAYVENFTYSGPPKVSYPRAAFSSTAYYTFSTDGSVFHTIHEFVGTKAFGDSAMVVQCGRTYKGQLSVLFFIGTATSPTAVIEPRICKTDPNNIVFETYGEVAPSYATKLWFNQSATETPDWVEIGTTAAGTTFPYKQSLFTFRENQIDNATYIECCVKCPICKCRWCDLTSKFYINVQGSTTKTYGTYKTYGYSGYGVQSEVWNLAATGIYEIHFVDHLNVDHLLDTVIISALNPSDYEIVVEYTLACDEIEVWFYNTAVLGAGYEKFNYDEMKVCQIVEGFKWLEDIVTNTTTGGGAARSKLYFENMAACISKGIPCWVEGRGGDPTPYMWNVQVASVDTVNYFAYVNLDTLQYHPTNPAGFSYPQIIRPDYSWYGSAAALSATTIPIARISSCGYTVTYNVKITAYAIGGPVENNSAIALNAAHMDGGGAVTAYTPALADGQSAVIYNSLVSFNTNTIIDSNSNSWQERYYASNNATPNAYLHFRIEITGITATTHLGHSHTVGEFKAIPGWSEYNATPFNSGSGKYVVASYDT